MYAATNFNIANKSFEFCILFWIRLMTRLGTCISELSNLTDLKVILLSTVRWNFCKIPLLIFQVVVTIRIQFYFFLLPLWRYKILWKYCIKIMDFLRYSTLFFRCNNVTYIQLLNNTFLWIIISCVGGCLPFLYLVL